MICFLGLGWQNKVSVEKTKQALESARNKLQIELQILMRDKRESENRRKKAETQLQELQVKHAESERQRLELAEKVAKMQVRRLQRTLLNLCPQNPHRYLPISFFMK